MIFGKIEYLNLLPFQIFMKRYTRSSQAKAIQEYKKGVPSKINRDFKTKAVDAAFISSIEAKRSKFAPLGIIAKKEVLSVLIIPSSVEKNDSASATSNRLAKVLNLKGEVVIGDRALKLYLQGTEVIDMAKMWNEKYKLPFVFALLCHNKHDNEIKKVSNAFSKRKVKIPQYILKKASLSSEISPEDILHYLEHISYKLDYKAKKGLKKFWKLT